MMKRRNYHGFTMIELMIVIAIIAIIAAVAIPNLLRSRVLANESNAVAALKAYATAQVTFQVSTMGEAEVNTKAGRTGYCDNFRNLFYGNPVNDPNANLVLITKVFADAFGRGPGQKSAPTCNSPIKSADASSPYQGYIFAEPIEMIQGGSGEEVEAINRYTNDFALLGVPRQAGSSGDTAFWLNQQGTVWRLGLKAGVDINDSIDISTPSASTGGVAWSKM